MLETLRKDVQHLMINQELIDQTDYSCEIHVDQDGRTYSFAFPTKRVAGPGEKPQIVQVTYELESLNTQVALEVATGTFTS